MMGKRTQYEPGTFSWIELATTDLDGAKDFYGRLFSWQADDRPIPDEAGGGTYTMAMLDAEEVAGLSEPASARQAFHPIGSRMSPSRTPMRPPPGRRSLAAPCTRDRST